MAWVKVYRVESGTRYRVFWRDPSGKQRGKVFKKRAEADKFKRKVEHDVEVGTYSDPARGRITLRELWEDFRSAPPRELAASTRSLYEMQWRVHIEPVLGDYRINVLQPEHVRGRASAQVGSEPQASTASTGSCAGS